MSVKLADFSVFNKFYKYTIIKCYYTKRTLSQLLAKIEVTTFENAQNFLHFQNSPLYRVSVVISLLKTLFKHL